MAENGLHEKEHVVLDPSSDKAAATSKNLEDQPVIDHAAEAKLIRKLDFMIIPPVMLLYLFSFLDRVSPFHEHHE
jgi:hypothetical protein